MAQGPQHKATVKLVLSGDTVILRGNPRPNGPPAERLLALSNVQAPRFGSKSREEEPFAFESREFLRKRLVGKRVTFIPEYTVTSTASPREYGTILLDSGENIAELGVEQGWLKVYNGRRDEDNEETMERLRRLEEDARRAEHGMWNPNEKGVRQVALNLDTEPRTFLNKFKGTPVDGIVDQVRDGSTYRILLLLPDHTQQMITLFLSGVRAPACKKDQDEEGQDTSEPFGEEAKYFVETRLLQRSVKVLLEGVSQSGSKAFVGSVRHPAGNISALLLSEGLAKCVDWSITMVTGGPDALRSAEKTAKDKKLRLWKGFVAKEKQNDAEFDGEVVKIVNGDTVIIRSNKGSERKLQLASVKQVPRGAGSIGPTGSTKSKDIKEIGYQFEAREFLRKKLIGKQVHVLVDYHKPAQDGFEAKDCATITIGNQNIGEQLVKMGLATVIRHRKDDDSRSHAYDKLLMAEESAKENQKGVHSPVEQPIVRIVDASESKAKATQYLNGFKRMGRLHAVVDHIVNGSRLIAWIPKENCRIALVIAGIRAPRVGRSSSESSEPYGPESLAFVTRHCLQRDIDIEVDNVDNTGAFIGSVFINGDLLATQLLRDGLAYVHDYSANECRYGNQLYAAERDAKSRRAGLWKDYDEKAEKAAEAAAVAAEAQEAAKPNREYIDIVVSEIVSGSRFYVQVVNDDIHKLEELMSDLDLHHSNQASESLNKPRVGEVVSAKFTEDNRWYRARVRKSSPEGIEVVYIDFGNSEVLSLTSIRTLPEKFKKLPNQAQEARLSLVKCHEKDENYGIESWEHLARLAGNKRLVANVDGRDGQVLHLTLFDPAKSSADLESLNLDMVRHGRALVDVKSRYARANERMIKALVQAQDSAKKERLGMFEYGDITDD